MTAIADFMEQIRLWNARPDFSDALCDGFIRTAESHLSKVLRVKEMMQISDGLLTQKRVSLPVDWRELDYVRVNDGPPLKYIARTDFFSANFDTCRKYTIVGNYILFGADIAVDDNLDVEISYYRNIPHLGDDPNFMYEYYYDIYLQATLIPAFLYQIETERAAAQGTYVSTLVGMANDEHMVSKVSGSQLLNHRSRMRF